MRPYTTIAVLESARQARIHYIELDRVVSRMQVILAIPMITALVIMQQITQNQLIYVTSVVVTLGAAIASLSLYTLYAWYWRRSSVLYIEAVACLSLAVRDEPSDFEVETAIEALRWTPQLRDRAMLAEGLISHMHRLMETDSISLGENALDSLRTVLKYAHRPPRKGYPSPSIVEASIGVLCVLHDTSALTDIECLAKDYTDPAVRDYASSCASQLRVVLAANMAPRTLMRASSEYSKPQVELLRSTSEPSTTNRHEYLKPSSSPEKTD